MPPPPKRERFNAKARSSIPGGSHKKRKRPSHKSANDLGSDAEATPAPAEPQVDLADLPAGLEGQRSQMSAKKRKRLDSYINKKLKSADRLKTLQLLASLAPSSSTSENLVSTASIGQYPEQGRSAKERDDLREDRLVRRGIDSLKRRFGADADTGPADEDDFSEAETRTPGESMPSAPAPATASKVAAKKRKPKKSKQASWNPNLLPTQASDSSSESTSEINDSDASDEDMIPAEDLATAAVASTPQTVESATPASTIGLLAASTALKTASEIPKPLSGLAGAGAALKRSAAGAAVQPRLVPRRIKMPRGRDAPSSSGSGSEDWTADSGSGSDEDGSEEEASEIDENDGGETSNEEAMDAPVDVKPKKRSLGFKAWAQAQIGQTLNSTAPDLLAAADSGSDQVVADEPPVRIKKERETGPFVGPLGSLEPIGQGPLASTLAQSGSAGARPIIKRRPSISEARMELPIMAEEQTIIEAIRLNPVVIVVGETGSGKTTQVPQMLYEAGFGHQSSNDPGMVGITQPRRIAATSLAARVRTELNFSASSPIVAHQIRYSSSASPETAIKFMTDGILLRELAADFLLSKYSVVVVDEAHERGVNTDVLVGVLSRVAKLREKRWKDAGEPSSGAGEAGIRPLRIVIMSATLSLSSFTANPTLFAAPPPVIHVPARQHPVTIHFSRKTTGDYVNEAYRKVVKIHQRLPVGGVLVFMTGQAEITGLARRLEKRFGKEKLAGWKPEIGTKQKKGKGPEGDVKQEEDEGKGMVNDVVTEAEDIELDIQDDLAADVDDGLAEEDPDALETDDELGLEDEPASTDTPMHILPLYSLLPTHKQLEVFRAPPAGHRLVIIATNVAETSLTIPGIRYVVDSGRAKEKVYDPSTGVQTFRVQWISKASAQQRAGRAGRTGPGHVYRLYSSALYEDHFPSFALPEIQRMPVEGLVLTMKSMGIDKVVNFPFPTPPDRGALAKAEELLTLLGALSRTSGSKIVNGRMVAGEEGGKITDMGRQMAKFPVTPRYGKLLAMGGQGGCLEYVVAIVAGLSVGDPFVHESSLGLRDEADDADKEVVERDEDVIRSKERAGWTSDKVKDSEEKKDLRRRFFKAQAQFTSLGQGQSDMFKLLAAVGAYEHDPTFAFCEKNFLRHKAMQEITQLRNQLSSLLELSISARLAPPTPTQIKVLRQLLLSSSLDLLAVRLDIQLKTPRSFTSAHNVPYRVLGLGTEPVYIHPSSALYANGAPPEWAVYTDVVRTEKRTWIKGLTRVNPAWIAQLAGDSGLVAWSRAEEVPRGSVAGAVSRGKGPAQEKGKPMAQGEREVITVPHLKGLGVDLPPVKKRQRREGTRWVLVE